MYRRPAFWVAAVLLFLGCALYAVRDFPRAFPVLTVDLKMDRAAALRQARDVAARTLCGPQGYRETAVFNGDDDVQNYVELEGGGKEAFRRLIAGNLYAPFQWIVRHYRPGEKNEATFYFTPEGNPYGFEETLAESAPGAALPVPAARALAESAAAGPWGVPLSLYKFLGASKEVRPSGRVDHTFVYERAERAGEARFRLTLTVSGGRLTALVHSVKVPQAFARRYQQMRSANATIATADQIAVVLLYGLGGCLGGLFYLLRRRAALVRGPLLAGLGVAFLVFLASLNELPLQWIGYDTALSPRLFLFKDVLAPLLRQFLIDSILFSLSFMAAEGLTRRAFPQHLQIGGLWSRDAAGSPEVLGRTVGGYLVVALNTAFVVAFYLFTARRFGWWSPSEMLIDPNLPSTYVPWFGPVAKAFQAGSWEESMFRAIPLAGAALIGSRFGCRRLAIALAFVVQVVLFGAGHASYAVQPAYGRIVELVVPATLFGLLYLRFGLLPAVLCHFGYDAVMMSLSLLVSRLPGIWIDRAWLFLLVFLPLWVVLWARFRRPLASAAASAWNGAWQPPAARKDAASAAVAAPAASRRAVLAWGVAGLAGVALWIGFGDFQNPVPRLVLSRAKAEEIARTALFQRGLQLDATWTVLSGVTSAPGRDDAFAWRHGSRADYRRLLERFLEPPAWQVRFVHFHGDVAQRAEEYSVTVVRHGAVREISHRLPEARPGAKLAEPAARTLAAAALRRDWNVPADALREISIDPKEEPARTDWELVWADPDPARYPLKEGEGRYAVLLAGGEVGDVRAYLHVPEAWERAEADRVAPFDVIRQLARSVTFAAMFAAWAVALVAWARGRFAWRAALGLAAVVFGLRAVLLVNNWPDTVAGFSTAQPFLNQALTSVGIELFHAFFASLSIGALAGFLAGRRDARPAARGELWGAAAAGFAWVGVRALCGHWTSLSPAWADSQPLSAALPWLAAAVGRLPDILYTAAQFGWLAVLAGFLARSGRLPGAAAAGAALVFGTLVYLAGGPIETLGNWLLSGVAAGLVFTAAFFTLFGGRRGHPAGVSLCFGVIGAAGALKQGLFLAHPGAWGWFLGAAFLAGAGWLWARR